MTGESFIAYIIVALAVVVFVFALTRTRSDSDETDDGSKENGYEQLPSVFKLVWGVSLAFEDSVGAALAEMMPKKTSEMMLTIAASALPLTPQRILCASAVLGGMFGIFGVVVAFAAVAAFPNAAMWAGLVVLLFLFWIGWRWPQQNLKAYTESRQETLTKQLPFAMDLLCSAMRAGLEFSAAMRYYVGIGVGGPLQEEFGRVLADVSLGKSFVESLQDMEKRVQIDAFSSFVGAVAYGAEIGAPLTGTLQLQGSELRRARFSLAERKAAKAPILMILPLAMFIMPSVFIVILTPMILKFMNMF